MSAKLEKALAAKKVLVRKRGTISGEVTIIFRNKEIKNVLLSHKGIVDLLSKRGVTTEAIRNSNLKELIKKSKLEVII